jgi:DNA-binding CsgD family transcriptional regulator
MTWDARDSAGPFRLDARDIDILKHLSDGLTDQQIAFKLRVSLQTIRRRVRAVLKKTVSASRTEAAIKALKAGLIAFFIIVGTLTIHSGKPVAAGGPSHCVGAHWMASVNPSARVHACRSSMPTVPTPPGWWRGPLRSS